MVSCRLENYEKKNLFWNWIIFCQHARRRNFVKRIKIVFQSIKIEKDYLFIKSWKNLLFWRLRLSGKEFEIFLGKNWADILGDINLIWKSFFSRKLYLQSLVEFYSQNELTFEAETQKFCGRFLEMRAWSFFNSRWLDFKWRILRSLCTTKEADFFKWI